MMAVGEQKAKMLFFGRMATLPLNLCTAVVYRDAEDMATKRPASAKEKPARQPRASITFPPDVYETLEQIAKEKKVSLAWVVREATESYIADKWPLFRGQR